VGKHPKFIAIVEQIKRIAATDSNVFLQGETGTGKELAARAIHLHSKRANAPFVVVDYSTLSGEMQKILPFSGDDAKGPYEKSVFEAANGGTIFIEQIEDLDMGMQARLLRILQDRKVHENAEWQTQKLDVRVITSTSVDLQAAVAEKKFRENLYFYLNVINIPIPPLRERKEDIGILCDHFLRQRAEKNIAPLQVLHPDALVRLMGYRWPGNVRELRNAIERAASSTEERIITAKHLPEAILDSDETFNLSFKEARRVFLEQFEKRYLENLIVKFNGNISRASENAGVTRMSFYRILKRIGMLKEADTIRHSVETRAKRQDPPAGKKPRS
jgi:DNA-binding NtrC family response regulator